VHIVFVNETSAGGSLLSTLGLADAVAALGVDVTVVHGTSGASRTRSVHEQLVDLRVRLRRTPLHAVVDRLARRPGRRLQRVGDGEGAVGVWRATVPANAVSHMLRTWRPDAVVVASISGPQWRQLRYDLGANGTPAVLYLRETTALRHLDRDIPAPDLLLANSRALAEAAAGHGAVFVPSVVDVGAARVESTRSTILAVNPTELYGGERLLRLARAMPEARFVLQESQPGQVLGTDVEGAAAELANVEVRRFTRDVASVYRDARLLAVPYDDRLDHHRPRSVVEAQANGIPVVASATPGLVETVGPGGVLVPVDATDTEWVEALRRLTDSGGGGDYERLVAAARAHAARPELDARAIAAGFVELVVAARR
jgi:hypothetical protein